MVERKPFTKVLFHEGTISTLYGLPGSGKSNLMTFLSECAARYKYNTWTIIHFFKPYEIDEAKSEGLLLPTVKYVRVPKNINTVKCVSDLLLGVLSNSHNATVLDEAATFASTRAPMSKKLRYILNLSYIIRHLRSSFVYVTQTKKSIPPEMRESLVSYEMNIKNGDNNIRTLIIKKRKDSHDHYGNDFITFEPIDTIRRVPLSVLPMDSHYIPKFSFDIDLDEAWNRLGEYGSLEVRKVGAGIIKKMVAEGKEKDEERESTSELRIRASDRFAEMLENDEFAKRGSAVSALAKEFEMSYSWAYQLTKDD